jgi:hypothetical protein
MEQTANNVEPQIFLPFNDPVYKQESGWQFAVLPTSESRYSQTKFSLQFLCRNGESFQVPDPIIVSPNEGAAVPEPIWAWVPIETEEGQSLAHSALPEREKGSVPLSEMPRDIIYTPKGLRAYGIDEHQGDLPYSLRAPNFDEVTLGKTPMCELDVENGEVLAIRPNIWPRESGLWTSHLARVVFIRAAQGEDL